MITNLSKVLKVSRNLGYNTILETNASGYSIMIGRYGRPPLEAYEDGSPNFDEPEELSEWLATWLYHQENEES